MSPLVRTTRGTGYLSSPRLFSATEIIYDLGGWLNKETLSEFKWSPYDSFD